MTPREFCYWLQGYFEINSNQPRPQEFCESLNSEQIKMIKKHLQSVFNSEIKQTIPTPQPQGTSVPSTIAKYLSMEC